MKVKYLKQHTDEFNFTFQAGWTAEHTDTHAQQLIDGGICERVADNVRPTRHADLAAPVLDQCIVPAQMQSSGISEQLPEPGEMPPLRSKFLKGRADED